MGKSPACKACKKAYQHVLLPCLVTQEQMIMKEGAAMFDDSDMGENLYIELH